MKSVAMHFAKRLEFALISASVAELMDQFDVSSAPALLVRKLSGEAVRYNGDFNAVALSDFLQNFASETIEAEVNRCAARSQQQGQLVLGITISYYTIRWQTFDHFSLFAYLVWKKSRPQGAASCRIC